MHRFVNLGMCALLVRPLPPYLLPAEVLTKRACYRRIFWRFYRVDPGCSTQILQSFLRCSVPLQRRGLGHGFA